MPQDHTVQQGECISSIAEQYGFFPDTLWNHSDNSSLQELREDPNSLNPGDVVVIPDKTIREETCAPEILHKFKRKGVPEKLRVMFSDQDDEPMANMAYKIKIDDNAATDGKTDPDGLLEEYIPPQAKVAVIDFEEGDHYEVDLGHMDPVTEVKGAQARLNNLGYFCGEHDGILDYMTETALREFQKDKKLEETGKLDDATIKALEDEYS